MKHFYLFRATLATLLFVCSASLANAQYLTAAAYPFKASNKPFTYLAAAATNVTPTYGEDDGYKSNIPIGFTFTFCGVDYTRVSGFTNGWMSFGNNTNYYYYPADQYALDYVGPAVFAGWADGMGGTGWKISYQTTGTPGSRIFTLEFKNWSNYNYPSPPAAYITYQYKLYEGANAVEIHYQRESGTDGFAGGAGIGIGKDFNDWQTLSSTGTNPTSSSTVFNTSTIQGNRPASGQSYVWGDLPEGMNNAGVASVNSPSAGFCGGVTLPVSVKIRNSGLNKIDSVNVIWSMDGAPFATINWKTPIDVLGSTGGNTAIVPLANVFFGAASHTFKVYTSDPNGIADTVNSDDTLDFEIGAALSGVYTIGGATPDFATFIDAVDALTMRGLCGPVIFKIRAGTYAAGVDLPAISGSSPTNRITFMPDDGVPASAVNIEYASAGYNKNYVLRYNGISYLTLKNLTLNSTGLVGYGTVIYFNKDSEKDSIVGCSLNTWNGPYSGYYTSDYSCIASNYNGQKLNDLKIVNNTFNGTYGVNNITGIYGDPATGFVFDNNTITAAYAGAGELVSQFNGVTITNNRVTASSTNAYTGIAGIDLDGTQPSNISNNTITGFYGNGLSINYTSGTSTNRTKIINNVVISSASTAAYNMFYLYGSEYTDVYNNTIITIGPNSTSNSSATASFNYLYDDNRIMNNVILNYAKGTPLNIYSYNPSSNNTIDYNTYYTSNTACFAFDGYNYNIYAANFPAWRKSVIGAAIGADKNSIFYDPGIDIVSGRPVASAPGVWALNGRAKQITGNNKDKDGNTRIDALANGVPDIGAFEVEPTSIPPLATPSGPALAGSTQHFIFGYDTVATVTWNPALGITDSLEVRAYSGRKAPGFSAISPAKFMYFYTDIKPKGSITTFDYNTNVYYKDIWLGTMPVESKVKLAERIAGTWIAYNGANSTASTARNFLMSTGLVSYGQFTGIDDSTIFSALVKPAGTSVICNGSRVLLRATKDPNFAYQWNRNGTPIPGATDDSLFVSSPGDYTVTIVAGGSLGSATSIKIAVSTIAPPMSQITASGPLTYCPGNTLTLNANTGAGLTHQWVLNGLDITGSTSPSYNVTTSGTYAVRVINIACSTLSNPAIVTPGPLTVSIGNDTAFCESKFNPYILDAGVTGAHYTWSTGDTTQTIKVYNKGGDYWVKVDAGVNCKSQDTVFLTVKPLPSVNNINAQPQGGNTWSFTPAGPQNVSAVQWIFPDGTTNNNNSVQHTFPDGNVVVKLVMYNDCGSDTTSLIIWKTGVNSTTSEGFEVRLYPNPANDKITLSLDGNIELKEVIVYNSIGAIVYRNNTATTSKQADIDVTPFASGSYIIKAMTTEGVISRNFSISR